MCLSIILKYQICSVVCVCIRAHCSYLELFKELGVCLLHLGSISCLPPFRVVFFLGIETISLNVTVHKAVQLFKICLV